MIVYNSRMEPRTQDGLSTSKYRSLFWVSCIPSSRPSVERYVFPLRIRAYDSAPIIIDGSVTNAFLPHIVGHNVLVLCLYRTATYVFLALLVIQSLASSAMVQTILKFAF
jgi:hypothetical protein